MIVDRRDRLEPVVDLDDEAMTVVHREAGLAKGGWGSELEGNGPPRVEEVVEQGFTLEGLARGQAAEDLDRDVGEALLLASTLAPRIFERGAEAIEVVHGGRVPARERIFVIRSAPRVSMEGHHSGRRCKWEHLARRRVALRGPRFPSVSRGDAAST